MRRTLLLLTAACLGGGASAGVQVALYDSYGRVGGESAIAITQGSLAATSRVHDRQGSTETYPFVTFGLDGNQPVELGRAYDARIGEYALLGSKGNVNIDPIDTYSAYLFTKFSLKEWSSSAEIVYDYGATRSASADALQAAFWFIENDLPYRYYDGSKQTWITTYEYDPHLRSVAMAVLGEGSAALRFWELADAAVRSGRWQGTGSVRALNLMSTDEDGNVIYSQNELVMIPAPDAGFLGLIGLAVLTALRRR